MEKTFNTRSQTHQHLTPDTSTVHHPDSGMLNLETHRLTLAIAKKTLDENHFKRALKTMDRTPPSFKIGNRVYFKNKQPGKWDLDIGFFKLSVTDTSYTLKTRPLEKYNPVI